MCPHDDIIKWKHFPCYWPFMRGIQVTGGFLSQMPVIQSFDVFFDLRLNKQSRLRWFETPSRSLYHCNEMGWNITQFMFLPYAVCKCSIFPTKIMQISCAFFFVWLFNQFLPLSPPGWRGIVVTVRASGRLGGRLPNLRNPYLGNCLTDFLNSKFCGIV